MPTFEMTVHDLRLLLAEEDIDAAFDELNYDFLQAQNQSVNQDVDRRCSIQCELDNRSTHAPENLTSPRTSMEEKRSTSP